MKKQKLLPVLPAIWAALFDIVITIYFQPKEYWAGNLSKANESNPIGATVMSMHVSGFFIIAAIWLLAIYLLGYYLPRKIASVFLLFVLIAHSWGGASWVNMHFGFWWVMLFFLVNAALYHYLSQTNYKKTFI